MKSQFHKYQAMGNDMIVVDPANFDVPLSTEVIRIICHRHFGAGADGICFGPLSDHAHPFAMRFFNPDGSEAEKSGNGLRIFARYLWDSARVQTPSFTIAIGDDIIPVQLLDETAHTISLEMGQLVFDQVETEMRFGEYAARVTKVSIGNPHAVIFDQPLSEIRKLGPLIETAAQFPNRTNVQLVELIDQHNIRIEIWERGAGYTLASGTSCSAAAGAAIKTGRCQSPITVHMAGGHGQVFVDANWQARLVGTVDAVYQATLSADMKKCFDETFA